MELTNETNAKMDGNAPARAQLNTETTILGRDGWDGMGWDRSDYNLRKRDEGWPTEMKHASVRSVEMKSVVCTNNRQTANDTLLPYIFRISCY